MRIRSCDSYALKRPMAHFIQFEMSEFEYLLYNQMKMLSRQLDICLDYKRERGLGCVQFDSYWHINGI